VSGDALETVEVEALVTDRYLQALLAAAERHATDAPADPALDPGLRRAARRLRDELVRVHPSFRFEDRLARRLAEAAAGMQLAAASGGHASVIPFPAPLLGDADLASELVNPELAALLGAPIAPAGPEPGGGGPGEPNGAAPAVPVPFALRPLLVGGAVTSAALGLAGAAFVAWRLTRGAPTDPMARAARIVRAARAGRGAVPGGLS
jgi:hypothetical protein